MTIRRGPRWRPLVLVPLLAGASFASPAAAAGLSTGTSIVAQATGSQAAIFRTTASKKAFEVLQNPNADGAHVVFLVRRRVPGWDEVRLPGRPNGSLGWVRAQAVVLALDPYAVTVSLEHHRITVWRSGKAILRAPAAVGRPSLPTPTGQFYIVELLKQSNPRGLYGPYAFGLSAYSRVLFSFDGGPGQIGLHGTNEPQLLGQNASHGCIRVSDAVISHLAQILPLGTPVQIRS